MILNYNFDENENCSTDSFARMSDADFGGFFATMLLTSVDGLIDFSFVSKNMNNLTPLRFCGTIFVLKTYRQYFVLCRFA